MNKVNFIQKLLKMRFNFFLCLICVLFFSCSKINKGTFKKIAPSSSGINFNNKVTENDTLNYLIFPYMYMGGGVSVGDINNDGLDDIFLQGTLFQINSTSTKVI